MTPAAPSARTRRTATRRNYRSRPRPSRRTWPRGRRPSPKQDTATITGCTFEDNRAMEEPGVSYGGRGGALFKGNGARLDLTDSTFLNNHAARCADGGPGRGARPQLPRRGRGRAGGADLRHGRSTGVLPVRGQRRQQQRRRLMRVRRATWRTGLRYSRRFPRGRVVARELVLRRVVVRRQRRQQQRRGPHAPPEGPHNRQGL